MTMASISPSRREVSPAESLRWRPKLLLPRFHLEMAVLRPESFPLIFFQVKTHHIVEDGRRGPAKWPTRPEGAPSTLVDGRWPPYASFFAQYFLYIPKLTFVEFQDFWSCAE